MSVNLSSQKTLDENLQPPVESNAEYSEVNTIAPPTEDDVIGVETEETSSGEKITKPFDPTLIRVETKPMMLDLLIARIRDKAINLEPEFQRKAGIWKEDANSRRHTELRRPQTRWKAGL